MEISTLQDLVVDALEDVKGQQIEVYDTSAITDLFDRVVIVSGTSNRQTRALAMSVVEAVRKAGGDIISTEGEETGEWVLVDCGDIIVHIMQPAIRTYYNLEELWGQTAIDVTAEKRSKFARGKSVKASGKIAVKSTDAAPKAGRKVAAKKAPVDEVKVETKTAAVKSAAAKKSAAKAPVVKAPVIKAPVIKAPAIKAPSVKAPTVKAPTVKAPAVKAPAVKAPLVKAPAAKAPSIKAPSIKAPAVKTPSANKVAAKKPAAKKVASKVKA